MTFQKFLLFDGNNSIACSPRRLPAKNSFQLFTESGYLTSRFLPKARVNPKEQERREQDERAELVALIDSCRDDPKEIWHRKSL